MADIKRTFTLKTIPSVCRNTRTVVWALCISARGIRMAFVHFHGMRFTAFVNVWKITYILSQNQAIKNVTRRQRKLRVTKFGTRNLWTPMFIIKRAKCFFKIRSSTMWRKEIQLILKYSKKIKVRIKTQCKHFQFLNLKQSLSSLGRNNFILLLITEIHFVLVDVWKYIVRHSAK